MKLTLKLFATLADYLPAGARSNEAQLERETPPTVATLIEEFRLPPHLEHLVLVNGAFISPGERSGRTLNDGDVLAIWPPIAGG